MRPFRRQSGPFGRVVRLAPVLGGALLLFCLVDEREYTEPLRVARADTLGDTVSIFPTFVLAFSQALRESSVTLLARPPLEAAYSVYLNRDHDTCTFIVYGPLKGRTRYCVRFGETLIGHDGSRLYPSDDSLVFVTHAAEVEPNNMPATADTLQPPHFGILATADDSDYFFLGDPGSQVFTLILFDHGGGCCFVDARGQKSAVDDPATGFTAPDAAAWSTTIITSH